MSVFVAPWWLAGCAAPNDQPSGVVRDASVPPPSTNVTRNQAWRDAEAIASLDPNRLTVIGAGVSMRPIYGENTVLVLQKVPYERLSAGMNVAYRNQHGGVVLHRLIARDARGWRAVGFNNEVEDFERVTPENLLGTVYAAFANADVK
ncbi:MAG: hypothetical protein NTU80_12180 [Verrucomicrobia bacterium]|nr:hypothetical protein [Verrucomicrobiota bacterium]